MCFDYCFQSVCDGNGSTQSKVGGRLKAFIVAFGTAGVGISCVSTVSMYNASEHEHKPKIYWNGNGSSKWSEWILVHK